MKKGDIVIVRDGSLSAEVMADRIEHSSGVELASGQWKVLAVSADLRLPAMGDFSEGAFNNTIIQQDNRIVFIQERFLRRVINEEEKELDRLKESVRKIKLEIILLEERVE